MAKKSSVTAASPDVQEALWHLRNAGASCEMSVRAIAVMDCGMLNGPGADGLGYFGEALLHSIREVTHRIDEVCKLAGVDEKEAA